MTALPVSCETGRSSLPRRRSASPEGKVTRRFPPGPSSSACAPAGSPAPARRTSAFTYYTGFKVNSGEYKVMGLAPYGKPRYVDLIYHELVDLREDGSFTLNQAYFNYLTGLTMTNGAFDKLFGDRPRVPETKLTQR